MWVRVYVCVLLVHNMVLLDFFFLRWYSFQHFSFNELGTIGFCCLFAAGFLHLRAQSGCNTCPCYWRQLCWWSTLWTETTGLFLCTALTAGTAHHRLLLCPSYCWTLTTALLRYGWRWQCCCMQIKCKNDKSIYWIISCRASKFWWRQNGWTLATSLLTDVAMEKIQRTWMSAALFSCSGWTVFTNCRGSFHAHLSSMKPSWYVHSCFLKKNNNKTILKNEQFIYRHNGVSD